MTNGMRNPGTPAPAAAADAEAAAAFEQLPLLVAADVRLAHRARHLAVECLIEIGAVPFYAAIAQGRLEALERGPLLMRPWRFAVRAPAAAWLALWQPVPAPGWHDLMALAKRGEARLEGDLHPLMANLQYFKDVSGGTPPALRGGLP